jgi:hypothetical protein
MKAIKTLLLCSILSTPNNTPMCFWWFLKEIPALARAIKKAVKAYFYSNLSLNSLRTRARSRTETASRPLVFETSASTNSAIRAIKIGMAKIPKQSICGLSEKERTTLRRVVLSFFSIR